MKAIDAKKLEVGQKVLFTPNGKGGRLHEVSGVIWIAYGVKVWIWFDGDEVLVPLNQIHIV